MNSASRRHSSSTASAEESNWRKPEASATACAEASLRIACASMRLQGPASACVSCAGNTSTATSALAAGVDAIALGQGGDQAVDALGVDLRRELAAVGFHQPHAQD